jgi:hypothetical protein
VIDRAKHIAEVGTEEEVLSAWFPALRSLAHGAD